ncbi:hypothetical protein [Micrococcus luteus]|uniref:hypothetical protein n=1 Tax=Micrococcus luteus TaxID=1270 RepID=UPI00230386EF|nr:hypothetical protein [Micrococcus luteus]
MSKSAAHQIPWTSYEAWARTQWSAVHGPGAGNSVQYKDLAAAAGYAPQRLVKQKRAAAVPIYAVRDLARGLGIDPIAAVATFTPIPLTTQAPAPREWITQLDPAELHAELLSRLGYPAPTPDTGAYTPRPHPWAAALLDGPRDQPPVQRGQRRKHAAHHLLEIPYASLRAKEHRGSWTIPELVRLCDWAGWHLGLALAVTGWFTCEELGLNPEQRHSALGQVQAADLVAAIEAGLPDLLAALDEPRNDLEHPEQHG